MNKLVFFLIVSVAMGAGASTESFVGDYVLERPFSSLTCPETVFVRDIGRPVFYTNIVPAESNYQIIGQEYYPRTGENLAVGYFETMANGVPRYVQKRYRRDASGQHKFQFFDLEVRASNGVLIVNHYRRPIISKGEDVPFRPVFNCIFTKVSTQAFENL